MASDVNRSWVPVRDGLYRYQDSCVIYALQTTAGMMIVNAGTGDWLAALEDLPSDPHCVILTHFFRDHSAGAVAAAARGIPVWAPYWEQEQLADVYGLFSRRETYIIYDNNWDLFSPCENIPVDRWLLDWEELTIGDTRLRIVPTPGVSVGAITVMARHCEETGAFCGEMIHSPGKIARIAPLQYNYNDLDGAPNLIYSVNQIRALSPSWLAGSLAPAVIEDADTALDGLQEQLLFALRSRGGYEEQVASATTDEIDQVTPHLYQSRFGGASTYFLTSEGGKVLSIDYGYRIGLGHGGGYPYPRNRRPILHGLEPLERKTGQSRIDAVLVTHFHDDHVNGIPLLQRLHGSTCYAADTFSQILEDPEAYAFPCTWPEAIDVTSLPADQLFHWEEYEFSFHPISGHTRYATMIAFEVDGERVVATGDQFFFQDFDHPASGPSMHNHVYRNGAVIGSIAESVQILKALAPTVIIPGHGAAYRVPEPLMGWIEEYADDYHRIHASLMPLGEDDVHFEADSRAAWLKPYRSVVRPGSTVRYTAHVRNPYPRRVTLAMHLVLPAGWVSERTELELDARAEGSCVISVEIPATASMRRHPLTLEISGPDRPFGQVAEALITVGAARF